MKHPAYGAAFLLNPRYVGDKLAQLGDDPDYTDHLTNILERYLRDVDGDADDAAVHNALLEYAEFSSLGGAMANPRYRKMAKGDASNKAMHAHAWWQAWGKGWPTLCSVAMKLLSKVPSSSACERNWSALDHILSKRRCSLGSGRLAKLLKTRQNLLIVRRRDE